MDQGKTSNETVLRETVFRWLEDGMDSPYLLSFIIDIYEEDLEKGTAPVGTLTKAKEVPQKLLKSISIDGPLPWHSPPQKEQMYFISIFVCYSYVKLWQQILTALEKNIGTMLVDILN